MDKPSHVDDHGRPQMVDISAKSVTERRARASCTVRFPSAVWRQLDDGGWLGSKGPILHTALLAGVQAAKRTADWIPFCHQLLLEHVSVDLTPIRPDCVRIEASVRCSARTGVEMEALTAVSAAALTLYDMCKALSHELVIGELKLVQKSGGRRSVEATS